MAGTHGAYNTGGHLLGPGLFALYKAPQLAGFLTLGARLGLGYSCILNALTRQGKNIFWQASEIPHYPWVDIGVCADLWDAYRFRFGLSLDARMYVFKTISKSPVFLLPGLAVKWRF
jgi:hypothetical protein